MNEYEGIIGIIIDMLKNNDEEMDLLMFAE